MSAVKIDVADPARPRIVSTRGDVNFLWAAAQRSGILVFYPSLGDSLQRINPSTFSPVWVKKLGAESHAIETDGQRIFVALDGKPGRLVVLDGSGNELARVTEPDGWWNVYSTVYDPDTQRLYIGAGEDTGRGFAGASYIYDARQAAPGFLGKISLPSWDIAVRGTKLWRQRGRTLEAWDVTNGSAPKLLGAWEGNVERGPEGTLVRPQLGHMVVSRDGQRLYVAYRSVTESGGSQVLDWDAGFMIFDVSGGVPGLLTRQGWKTPTGLWVQPTSVALAPNGRILAVGYWAFGVRLFDIADDRARELGMVATTGEAHDVFVDNLGLLHIFANDNIQIVDPVTREHRGVFVTGQAMDGGWRPFKDGTIILPSARNANRYVLRIQDGAVTLVTNLTYPGPSTWDEIFEDPYLYSATDRGLHIQQIGAFDARQGKYPVTIVGSVDTGGSMIGHTKRGNIVWGIGPAIGVVAIDVSVPSAPRVVFHDRFTFSVNGNHAGIVAARGRIYAGAGDAGVIIYDAATFRRTGEIRGLNVNFLDKIGEDFLVVANYWYPQVMEGMVIYDLRRAPDTPPRALIFPGDSPNANFRVRVQEKRVYRVPLYGVDVLEIR